jgi:hypothetical protein
LPMLKILLPKCCQTPMWSTWPPTGRKVKPQVRRQIRMAPPARFELALPPPEGGALSPELRGRANFGKPGPLEGRMAMYQRASGEPLAVPAVTFCRSILDPCRAVSGARTRRGAAVLVVLLVLTSCVRPATPTQAAQRSTPPPWSAPRDAITYITAAGLEPQSLYQQRRLTHRQSQDHRGWRPSGSARVPGN